MPPKKRRKTVASTEDMSSQELMLHARKKVIDSLKLRKHNVDEEDIDQLITMIRAILKTNKEIWDRCSEAEVDTEPPWMEFKRFIFNVVEVTKTENDTDCFFKTTPEVTITNFGETPELPTELTDVVPFEKSKGRFPTQYESYLQKCLSLLHHEVLPHVLKRLQDHLESVQVFLGDIDSWLMESAICQEFLNETFEPDLIIPENEDQYCSPGCKRTHAGHLRCMLCNLTFQQHGFSLDDFFIHDCPDSGRSGRFKGFFPVQILKTCKLSGQFSHTFHIEKETEREKLKKFLEFSSLYK